MPLSSGGPPNNSSTQNRVHCGVNSVPPGEDAGDAGILDVHSAFFQFQAERLEQLRRGKRALHIMSRGQHSDRLIDAMLLVLFQVFHPPLLDQLHDPARIQIDAETDAAAMLCQVLDRQTQATGSRGAQHQPVRTFGEVLVRQRVAEQLVIPPMILDHHTAFRNASCAARLENVDRFPRMPCRNPTADRTAAEPFIFEIGKLLQVVERLHVLQRVEAQLRLLFQPKRAARLVAEVPMHRAKGVLV